MLNLRQQNQNEDKVQTYSISSYLIRSDGRKL